MMHKVQNESQSLNFLTFFRTNFRLIRVFLTLNFIEESNEISGQMYCASRRGSILDKLHDTKLQ